MNMITPIKAFTDNYIWLFYDEATRLAWVVDPGEAAPVVNLLQQLNLKLSGILLTHHHFDHTGGIDDLAEQWDNLTIVGSHQSAIHSITHPVSENDEISCPPFKFKVLEIPGHTLDHVAYYNDDILFSGDTLFSFGCGKVFEGTPEQMYQSLDKLKQLPDTTRLYCGHEYTLANLYFARHVEPNNQMIANKIKEVKELRDKNLPTLPSVMSIEKQMNPFLRCDQSGIIWALEHDKNKKLTNPVELFAALREWKNDFKMR